ncbi:hypothetical protein BY996DRAFT_6423098 [Phakopsora pachyrhizi]|nr:hypothetical protein BY996DRAFT_6423098 [Phakopsora pachyrhizi]
MESAADVAEIGENSLKIGSSPPSMPERKSFQKTRGKVLDDGELKPFEFPILNPSPLYLHFSPEKRFWDYTPGHKQEMLKNEIPSDNAAYFSKNLKEYSNSMSPISILEKTISLEGHETIGMLLTSAQ